MTQDSIDLDLDRIRSDEEIMCMHLRNPGFSLEYYRFWYQYVPRNQQNKEKNNGARLN